MLIQNTDKGYVKIILDKDDYGFIRENKQTQVVIATMAHEDAKAMATGILEILASPTLDHVKPKSR